MQRVGVAGTYGGGEDDDDDGLSTGAKIGIGIGVGAAIAGAAYGLGYIGPKAGDDGSSAALPGSADRYSAIRVAASDAPLAAGESRTVALLGQGVDGKWYRVDQRREASLEIKSPTSAVVKQDGSRNVFCVPLTAAQSSDGEAVTVVGKFRNPDGKVVSAETVIRVRVPAL